MSQHTQDGRVWAYDKRDPKKTKFRWPKHLVDMSDHLVLTPSERKKSVDTQRVTEPQTPANTRHKAQEAQK